VNSRGPTSDVARNRATAPSPETPSVDLSLTLPAEWIEAVAERAAAIVAEQLADQVDTGFLDVAGAAEFLACGKDRVYALVSAKRIPHHRDGSRLLFERAELRAWVAAGGGKRP
jgi:excisionase family DNA binding protein